MNFRRDAGISEIPSAPLIRESLSSVDVNFKKIKHKLSSEMPMLTDVEVLDMLRKQSLSDDYIAASLMAMGYAHSANEINHLMRVDFSRRANKPPRQYLAKNRSVQRALAKFFSQAEDYQRRGDWKQSHLVRMKIARLLFEKYAWLSQVVLENTIEFFCYLNSDLQDHEILKANVYLMLAFVLTHTKDDHSMEAMEYLLKSEAISEEICAEEKAYHGHISFKQKEDSQALKAVQIHIDRPIAIHGLRNSAGVQPHETITACDLSTFHAAAILHSWLYLEILKTKAHHSHKYWHEHDDLYMNEDEHNHTQETFKQGLALAIEGQNDTAILSTLFTYGKYLMRKSNYEEAESIFTQLYVKARECNDKESAAVAYNRLGKISHRKWVTTVAAEHFCSEWELGLQENHSVIIIDSIKSLGKILLEEGDFINAEMCFREAFDKYEQVRDSASGSTNPDETIQEDDLLFEECWASAGMSAGHSLWGRLAAITTFGKHGILPILEWKSNRRSLPKVHEVFFKPTKISQKPRPKQVAQSLANRLKGTFELEYLKQNNVKSADELLAEWAEALEDDGHKYQHDLDVEKTMHLEDLEFMTYRSSVFDLQSNSQEKVEEEEKVDEEEEEEEEEESSDEEDEEETLVEDVPEVPEEEEETEEDDEEEEEDSEEFEDYLEYIGEYRSADDMISLEGEGEDNIYLLGPNPTSDEENNFEAEEEEQVAPK